MTQEPVDKYLGIPMSQWIAMLPHELGHDCVFFFQIIPVGRDSFGLQGAELVDLARRSFLVLLDKGGKLCLGNVVDPKWAKIVQSNASNEEIVELIIDAWQNSAVEPDWYELWFDRPIDSW